MHENRETSKTPAVPTDSRSAGEGSGRTARAYVCEESHSGVLPMNHSNKDTRLSAESGEGRPLIKENAGQSNTYPTQSGDSRVTGVGRRAESSKGTQGDEVHRLAPPPDGRSATGKLLLAKEESRTGSGRG